MYVPHQRTLAFLPVEWPLSKSSASPPTHRCRGGPARQYLRQRHNAAHISAIWRLPDRSIVTISTLHFQSGPYLAFCVCQRRKARFSLVDSFEALMEDGLVPHSGANKCAKRAMTQERASSIDQARPSPALRAMREGKKATKGDISINQSILFILFLSLVLAHKTDLKSARRQTRAPVSLAWQAPRTANQILPP